MSVFEVKKDFTAEVAVLLPETDLICEQRGIDEAITLLFTMEKKCRTHNDSANLTAVCLHMLILCKRKDDWTKLNSVLSLINKRASQNKSTVSSVVNESMKLLESTPTEQIKVELIKTLKEICDGKIYVESESAKLHFVLSKIYESRNDIDAACEIIQDVHVETYGSLSKKEKAEYILEQIRLNLIKKDYIRTMIHSRKMNLKTIEESGFEEIKIKFYTMMIEYHTVDRNSWEICLAYHKICLTNVPKDNESDGGEYKKPDEDVNKTTSLESCIIFLLMSKFDNHQSDLLHRLRLQLGTDFKHLPIAAVYSDVLTLFATKEIIPSPFPDQSVLESHNCLKKVSHLTDSAEQFTQQLRDRVVQHNLRVVASYYKRIYSSRLCELLDLSADRLESYLTEISSEGDLHLRIDRPQGIISFNVKKVPEEVLSDWSSDIGKMLHLMESTCHLINREVMVYKA